MSVKETTDNQAHILILGIGNVLMGDEGVGVHVVRRLERMPLPANVRLLDGGTGSFQLLEAIQEASRVLLVDATVDGEAPGTVRRLTPRFASDYPATLTAHDIGLKDLLDVAYLTRGQLEVTLFAVSIDALQGVATELSVALAKRLDAIAETVYQEACRMAQAAKAEQPEACRA